MLAQQLMRPWRCRREGLVQVGKECVRLVKVVREGMLREAHAHNGHAVLAGREELEQAVGPAIARVRVRVRARAGARARVRTGSEQFEQAVGPRQYGLGLHEHEHVALAHLLRVRVGVRGRGRGRVRIRVRAAPSCLARRT